MEADWKECKLGDVVTLKRGYDLPTDDRNDGDVPIVSSSGITGCHDSAKVDAPGVVTGRYGTLGEVFYLEQDFWPLNTALYVKDFHDNHPRFVHYFLQTINFEQQNAASSVPGVNRNHLHKLEVQIPPLPVQRRIVGILGAYDDLIANNRRRIDLLEEMATAIFREWFVHYRFPGHADVGRRETEIGAVPDSDVWTVKELQEVATVNRANLRDSNAPEEIHYLTISNVSEGTIEAPETMSWEDSPGRAKRVVQHGDVIWSSVRPYLEGYGLMMHPRPNTIVSTGFAVLTPDELPYSYLYQYVTTEDFISYLDKVATGAAYPSANVADFKEGKILVPPSDLVERYHDQAEPIYEQINNLRNRNRVLRETRDLLLPRLVSGEVEVETEMEMAPKVTD